MHVVSLCYPISSMGFLDFYFYNFIIFVLFCLETYITVIRTYSRSELKDHSWQDIRDYMGPQGLNPGELHASQASYPLHYNFSFHSFFSYSSFILVSFSYFIFIWFLWSVLPGTCTLKLKVEVTSSRFDPFSSAQKGLHQSAKHGFFYTDQMVIFHRQAWFVILVFS